jgi:NAD(P)-dependent dehydrogenase (short-subunit alcohol dehydrogenase family)
VTNIVIGAASGMGIAVAKALAPRGRLIVADRNLEGVRRVAAEIGGNVEAIACDITNQSQIEALVARIDQLDAIVLTAGLSASMALGRRVFEVNLIGVARVCKAVEPLLRPGSVGVCFASISAHRVREEAALMAALDDPLSPRFLEQFQSFGVDANDSQFAYPMSKRGILRMVRRLAPSWGACGARILSVSPGINDTPMNRLDEENHPIMAQIIQSSPLGRRGQPQEVANVVAFLTSAQASYMTGSDVLVDGGMVAVLPSDTTTRQ